MKKLVKIMAVAVLAASSVGAITLEEYNAMIASVEIPAYKQNLLCEREADLILKDPQLCIRAAQISSKEYDTMPVKYYSSYKEFSASMYNNAGIIYSKIGDNLNKVKMYKKVLELLPNDIDAHVNLGLAYYLGKGV